MKVESPCKKCLVNTCCTKRDKCNVFDRYTFLYDLVKTIYDKKVVGIDPILLDLYKSELITISKDVISMNIEKHFDEDYMSKVRSKFKIKGKL